MPWIDAFAPAEAHYRQLVMADTWGHLAPHKNRVYRGHVVFAIGCFGSDNLNPTVLDYSLTNKAVGSLESSPWFYDALAELLTDIATMGMYGDDRKPLVEVGGVYRWEGTFRNYAFDGKVQRLQLVNPLDSSEPATVQ